jgi:selenium donor protein
MADQTPRLTSLSPGAGCACKLPLAKLEELFASMGPGGYPGLTPAGGDLLIGAAEGDDAAVLRLDDERALVLTTDFFTPIVDDPYDWGRIAAANALSDVYAMGGRPLFAVNLAAWPGDGLDVAILGQVLRGGAQVGAEAGCFVAGGHTIDDPVPKYGLAVVGLADPARLLTIDRAVPGDQLIVTKAIGTGVIATAVKYGAPPPGVLAAAIASMTVLNAGASEAALAAGVRAGTDVTGFSLLGPCTGCWPPAAQRPGSRPGRYRCCPARPSWPRPVSSPAGPGPTPRASAWPPAWPRPSRPSWPRCCMTRRLPAGCCWLCRPGRRPPCSMTCAPAPCLPLRSARSCPVSPGTLT